jgi:hypothetical protein
MLKHVVHVQNATQTIAYCATEIKSEAVSMSNEFPNFPRGTWVIVTLVARLLLLHTGSAGESRMCAQARCVYILKHYFASRSCAAVRAVLSNAYPDREVQN